MAQVDTIDWQPHWTTHPLIRALALSLAFHLGLFSTLEVGNRLDLWRFSPLVWLAKMLKPELGAANQLSPTTPRSIALPEKEPQREYPVMFVDVDPSQATEEAPPNTKYYSAVNSLAANRDTSRDTSTPLIDGTQDKVLKTMDTDRARPNVVPLQPTPVVPQQPQKGLEAEPVKPQPVVANPNQPAPEPVTTPEPERARDLGETLMAKATKASAPVVTEPQPPVAETPAAPRTRPRTVAAALAQRQLNPNSALIGQKYKQDGGVKRFSISSSLDVAASPLGNYDARFIAAVQQCWYGLLEEQRYSLDRVGKVVLDFRLTMDGRITDMKVVESNVGDLYTEICKLAIGKPSPYEKWPTDVRKMVGASYRDVRFTFYY